MKPARAAAFFALLFAALCAAYAPMLDRPLTLDELDTARAALLPAPQRRELCRNEFVRSLRFRPAMAATACEVYRATGASPRVLRLFMLLLLAGCAAALRLLGKRLGLSETAASLGAGLFSLSWCHWETLAHTLNFGQLLSYLLVFAGLAATASAQAPARLWGAVALAAVGALFKEDAVVFGPLALGLWVMLKRRAPRPAELLPFLAAGAGYALLRAAMVLDFTRVGTAENQFDWTLALSPSVYAYGLRLAAAPLGEPLNELLRLARGTFADSGALAGAGLAAGLAAAAGALIPMENARKPPRAALVYCAVLAFVGQWPFIFFKDGLLAHRVGRVSGGLALACAAGLAWGLARLGAKRPRAARAAFCLLLALSAGAAAAAFRRPDPRHPLFPIEADLHNGEHVRAALTPLRETRDGDAVSFDGFGSMRAAAMFAASAPEGVEVLDGEPEVFSPGKPGGRVWVVRLRAARRLTATIRRWPDGREWTFQWDEGRCAGPCAWDPSERPARR